MLHLNKQMSCVGVLVKCLLARGQCSCKSCLQCHPASSPAMPRLAGGKCHLHRQPSAWGAARGPEMPHYSGQGFREMQRWDFNWALVCEHQPWLGLAAVTPLSRGSWWLPREPAGQQTQHHGAQDLLGRCHEVAAIACLPGNRGHGGPALL